MVLDSRSRIDSNNVINGNGADLSGNNFSNRIEPASEPSKPPTSIPTVSGTKKKSLGQWWKSVGLQAKTTIISVAAITIPLLMIGGFTYYYVGQNIIESTKQAKALRNNGMGYRVAYFMRERYGDIQVLAQLSFLTNSKVQAILSIAEQKSILDTYLKSYVVYDSIAVYRLDGTLIVDASSEPPPANIAKRAYFQTVLSTDKPFISQPEASVVTKKVSIFIAAPIKDIATGKTIAIVRSRMPTSSLEEIIKDFSAGGEQYHLSESDGKFFLALEKDQVGRDLKTDFSGIASLVNSRQFGAARSVDLLTNKEQFVGYAPLPKLEGLPDLKWDAVIAVDTETALKPLQQLLLILVAATGTIGILAAVLAIAIARRATRPIIEATEAVLLNHG